MAKKSILIFPAGMPRSVEFLNKCKESGREVVGSSSLAYDPARELYSSWATLPYVTDSDFNDALKKLIVQFNIGEIYTPNIVVWNYLDKNLAGLSLEKVSLSNISPVDEVLSGYRAAVKKAQYFIDNPLPLDLLKESNSMPEILELAGLCRYADLVPGMCDDEKFHVLLEIARHSVSGDVVEIGSWWGKSAFILAWLSRHFKIGNLLCVDPWCNENLVQNETIVDSGSMQVNADEALNVFKIGLLPFNSNHINYLRMPSCDGASHYAVDRVVSSPLFGETRYKGQISILHIDGNHAYEAVKIDINSWVKFMKGGSWIIFDDYLWPYGDGPKRVADEFLNYNINKIANSFVMGGALFIQLIIEV